MREKSTDRLQISVISLWRNSSTYIDEALKRLEGLEKKYDMDYYFYENDSEDNTLERLKQWLRTRNGSLISETLSTQHYGPVADATRIDNFVKYRNTILNEAKPLNSDYTLLLDSDVSYNNRLIKDSLKYMTDDVAMVTPNILQNLKCEMGDCTKQSYYDSFALKDKLNQQGLTWSCNPFVEPNDRMKWKGGKPVEVNSAFGGAPLIRTSVLNKPSVIWSVNHTSLNNFYGPLGLIVSPNKRVGCEHWNFCKVVRSFGKILVVPSIKVSTIVNNNLTVNPAFIEQQKKIIKDPWTRLVANL